MEIFAMGSIHFAGAVLLFAQPDGLSGGAGLAGAGLIGATLAWLFFVHLPAKDKQIKELVTDKDEVVKHLLGSEQEEREKDRIFRDKERDARHAMADMFQQTMSQIEKDHAKAMADASAQHILDAEKDRDAFSKRHESIVTEIRLMVSELKNTLLTSCKFSGDCLNYAPRPSGKGNYGDNKPH